MTIDLRPLGRADLTHRRPTSFDRFWFGACYYPEHWDAATRTHDAERMRAAGINVVRMGEFSWDLFEPSEGRFDFTLYDDVIAHLGRHGISTMLGTPTAAPPRWLSLGYPDIHRVDARGVRLEHGSRQHACHQSPTFNRHSERITAAMATHFAGNPHVVGWQTDNEFHCHFSECHCANCQLAFQGFLARRHRDIAALNAAWGTAFWAQTYRDFDEVPTPRDGLPTWLNPGHRLDYVRFLSDGATRFQHHQVAILRAARPEWFVFHNGRFGNIDYRGLFSQDLDCLGYDVYPMFQSDPAVRPRGQSWGLDETRACAGNFIVPEQQSGPGGQPGYFLDHAEPGELRQMSWRSIARGADALLYFRWRSCRFGAEEYWCGILDHDDVPRRRYREVAQIGGELARIGPALLGTSVRVDCALAAADLVVGAAERSFSLGLPGDDAYAPFYDAGYAVGLIHPADDLSGVKLYLVPHWAAFDPAWVPALERWVRAGGVLVIGARSGTRDRENRVVPATAPGCLRALVGAAVDEYGKQNAPEKRPLAVTIDGTPVPTKHWYEILLPDPGTEIHAAWRGRHLEGSAAITRRGLGSGWVIYVGTHLTAEVVTALRPGLVRLAGLQQPWPTAPTGCTVTVREAVDRELWFFFNESDEPMTLPTVPVGIDLVTGQPARGPLTLERYGVAIIRVERH